MALQLADRRVRATIKSMDYEKLPAFDEDGAIHVVARERTSRQRDGLVDDRRHVYCCYRASHQLCALTAFRRRLAVWHDRLRIGFRLDGTGRALFSPRTERSGEIV